MPRRLNEGGAVRRNLGNLTVDALVAVVQEIGSQTADAPRHLQLSVRFLATPVCPAATGQTNHTVGIPVAVTNPTAQELGAAREVEGTDLRSGLGDSPRNLIFQLRGNHLIGIQIKRPRGGGLV